MIKSISNAELHETTPTGYKEEVKGCGKSSPHSAPTRPTQGASITPLPPQLLLSKSPCSFFHVFPQIRQESSPSCAIHNQTLPDVTFESSHHPLFIVC